jgi:hypothetical protein
MRLLLAWYAFLILVASLESITQESGIKTEAYPHFSFVIFPAEPQQSSILLSSLSIYFFQYVKELLKLKA